MGSLRRLIKYPVMVIGVGLGIWSYDALLTNNTNNSRNSFTIKRKMFPFGETTFDFDRSSKKTTLEYDGPFIDDRSYTDDNGDRLVDTIWVYDPMPEAELKGHYTREEDLSNYPELFARADRELSDKLDDYAEYLVGEKKKLSAEDPNQE